MLLSSWRRIERALALSERDDDGQLRLGFAEIDEGREVWEYAVLVTSLDREILSLGQLYRDRADCENSFDELKNQWGWGGFTTRDLKRCRLMAGCVALMFNWWNLFVRLADPDHHREAITSRPLLLQAIGRQTSHAGRTTLTITSSHGEHPRARAALTRIAGFFAQLRKTAEQLTALERWYRILSQALVMWRRRVGIDLVEGVGEAYALNRLLRDVVNHNRCGDADDLQDRRQNVDHMVELPARAAG